MKPRDSPVQLSTVQTPVMTSHSSPLMWTSIWVSASILASSAEMEASAFRLKLTLPWLGGWGSANTYRRSDTLDVNIYIVLNINIWIAISLSECCRLAPSIIDPFRGGTRAWAQKTYQGELSWIVKRVGTTDMKTKPDEKQGNSQMKRLTPLKERRSGVHRFLSWAALRSQRNSHLRTATNGRSCHLWHLIDQLSRIANVGRFHFIPL